MEIKQFQLVDEVLLTYTILAMRAQVGSVRKMQV